MFLMSPRPGGPSQAPRGRDPGPHVTALGTAFHPRVPGQSSSPTDLRAPPPASGRPDSVPGSPIPAAWCCGLAPAGTHFPPFQPRGLGRGFQDALEGPL